MTMTQRPVETLPRSLHTLLLILKPTVVQIMPLIRRMRMVTPARVKDVVMMHTVLKISTGRISCSIVRSSAPINVVSLLYTSHDKTRRDTRLRAPRLMRKRSRVRVTCTTNIITTRIATIIFE